MTEMFHKIVILYNVTLNKNLHFLSKQSNHQKAEDNYLQKEHKFALYMENL